MADTLSLTSPDGTTVLVSPRILSISAVKITNLPKGKSLVRVEEDNSIYLVQETGDQIRSQMSKKTYTDAPPPQVFIYAAGIYNLVLVEQIQWKVTIAHGRSPQYRTRVDFKDRDIESEMVKIHMELTERIHKDGGKLPETPTPTSFVQSKKGGGCCGKSA